MKRLAAAVVFVSLAALLGLRDFRAVGPPAAKDSVSVLDEILRSRDDNDPRLDADFNGLSVETRRRFREKYRAIPPEGRNERGTIVYLLGKNLHAPEDWAFLREVAGEPPCLSLSDCARAPSAGEDGSEDSGAAVTLAYPALVALKQAERVLAEGPASARSEARSVARAGKGSRASVVIEAAARLESRF